ncbi:hypothetical protein LJB90_00340 [Eubacteriales bacterium OttesenSCG-928-G02]|nr:hypothetical protein [Eubacteriales bacterium OttesenSCG-928-G02]
MKKIKIIILCVTIIILISVIVVSAGNALKMNEENSNFIFKEVFKEGSEEINKLIPPGTITKVLSNNKKLENIPASEIITQTYDIGEFRNKLGIHMGNEIMELNVFPLTLRNVNSRFPIECMRKINENNLMVIYKLTFFNDIIYAYCNFVGGDVYTHPFYKQEHENWAMKNIYFLNEIHEYNDLKDVKIGTSIFDMNKTKDALYFNLYKIMNKELKSTDVKTAYYYHNIKSEFEKEDYIPILEGTIEHYFKDGIMKIYYKSESLYDEYKINKIEFNDKFIINKNTKYECVFKINDIDLPNENVLE